ncbi:MAG TPA: sialidase family protein [Pirellulales bacterium]|jgi:photosystem II stability/assembly factor-like uncharacterized protein|nr:sialidase family protein [Pirellulales bacterium]
MAIGTLVAWPTVSSGQAPQNGKWVNISDSVVAKLAREGKKIGWPGLTSGVGVDRTNGDVYMVVCDNGLWKSSDHGATFVRVDGGNVTGRCETGFGLDIDPAGNRLACITVYGNSAISLDAGKTWQKCSQSHLDCVAVAWPETSLLAIKHESGGVLIVSPDGGKTWKTLDKGFNGIGLFDAKTFVGCKAKGIVRSTDGGQTWTAVSDLRPSGKAMRVFKGIGYWVGPHGLLVSRDQGATWSPLGKPVECSLGPYFGKDERNIVVLGKQGIMKTTDAGQTWKLAAPLPHGVDGDYMCQCGWDPTNNIFYAGKMGKPTFKFQP